MPQKYIDTILDLYGMQNAKPVATTGTVTINKTVPDTPLSPEEHKVYRTAVGKLLWLALVRGDIAYATKELSRDVTAPTMQSDITAEQLVIDVAALSDLTEAEVRQTGVQSNLLALHLAGNVPDDRPDLQRLAQGLPVIRSTADPATVPTSGPAAMDAALGIHVRNGTEETAPPTAANEPNDSVPEAPAPSGANEALNAVPWEARHLMNEVLVPHRLSRHGPVNAEVSAALTAMDCGVELTRVWSELDAFITTVVENDRQRVAERGSDLTDRMLRAQVNLAEEWRNVCLSFPPPGPAFEWSNELAENENALPQWMIETSWTQMTKAERLFLTKRNWHVEWRAPHYAKENALVNVYDWLCLPLSLAMGLYTNGILVLAKLPCHQRNGSYNALSAPRKTVQWANQGVFEESEHDEPTAFVVFRRTKTKTAAMRRWVAGGPNANARVKLANYFNRLFTDHISTVEWDGNGPDDWKWTMEPLSHTSAGIVRVPMTDPMCVRSPKLLLSLNEISEWGMFVTHRGHNLVEWRLMGHTMILLTQCVNAVLEQDCSTWEELYGNDEEVKESIAWNAQEPGSEIVLRKNAKGTVK
ncbi:unnamed protein product [Symbiodinium sp. CCMP2592]|nr:unnamed protein product [Symbiodinium sp. CCMP2592]